MSGLQTVQNIVLSRTALPILNNTLLQAQNGELVISTTDIDMGLRVRVPCEVIKAGATTLPVKKLASIIRELPASEVSLEVDSKQIAIITSGAAFFRINGLPEEDFPSLPTPQDDVSIKMTQGVLRDMLKRTSYAMSADPTRYNLNGVFLSFKNDKLATVATDGRRMALVEQELEFPKSAEVDRIIPSNAVGELQRILGDDVPLQIMFSENLAFFDLGKIFLYTKLIEGDYPKYERVVPAEAKERIILERAPLIEAIKRVSLLSNEKSNSVRLAFTRNSLDITANTPEIGEARETMAVNYKGVDFAMAFNPGYLIDPLKSIEADEIYFDFIDETNPGVIRYNRPFLYVIMPMRTHSATTTP